MQSVTESRGARPHRGCDLPVRTNPLLLAAVLSELGLLLVLLYVPPAAHVLGHSGPTIAGLTIAITAIPAVLLADGIHKRFRRHARDFRL